MKGKIPSLSPSRLLPLIKRQLSLPARLCRSVSVGLFVYPHVIHLHRRGKRGASVGVAQEATIKPNENLEAEGIPPIPAQIATRAHKYTDYRQAMLGSWDPSGRQMLILTRFADSRQVHLVQFPGGDRKQLTFFPDSVFKAQFPNEPANYFLFTKDIGGNEFYQIYRFDLNTGDTSLLTDGKSRNQSSLWSHQGKRLVYTSTRRNGKDNDLYLIDDASASTDHLLAKLTVEVGNRLIGLWITTHSWFDRKSRSTRQICSWWMPAPAKKFN